MSKGAHRDEGPNGQTLSIEGFGGGSPLSYTVEIYQSILTVNDESYGTVNSGDRLLIDGNRVTINGSLREPQ